jgi:hypothetical protein
MGRQSTILEIEAADRRAAVLEKQLAELTTGDNLDEARANLQTQINFNRDAAAKTRESLAKVDRWHRPIRVIQTLLPKTSETIGLLTRWLKKDSDIPLTDLFTGNFTRNARGEYVPRERNDEREVTMRMEEELESRSEWYVIGTSVVFEIVMLVLACFIFIRRDF